MCVGFPAKRTASDCVNRERIARRCVEFAVRWVAALCGEARKVAGVYNNRRGVQNGGETRSKGDASGAACISRSTVYRPETAHLVKTHMVITQPVMCIRISTNTAGVVATPIMGSMVAGINSS